MVIVRRSCDLDAPAQVVWRTVQTPQAFVHVAAPVLRFPVAERVHRPWRTGDAIVGWTWLLGVVPFSRHHLAVAAIDDEAMTLDSDEHGGVVRVWRHHIAVTPLTDATCRYVDEIDIDAGPLTPVVAAFARVFYAHRQRRWRRLAPLLAAVGPGSECG
jgi:hypothetical protein